MDMLQSALFTILGYLRLIQLTDILDILAATYLINKGMTMLRRSSAAQVAKALIFILAILWLSYQLNFGVINFVLGKTMELGLLALVIVFQPEIRRFLEQIGSSDFAKLWTGRAAPADELEVAIRETVAAYVSMSKDKIGALTVFERVTPLGTEIDSGTVMDAAVSSELLKNIFFQRQRCMTAR